MAPWDCVWYVFLINTVQCGQEESLTIPEHRKKCDVVKREGFRRIPGLESQLCP